VPIIKSIKYCLSVFILLNAFQNNYAQNQDSLIQLYPGMGDTISYVDRTYFGLYNQISGFENAVVYIKNDDEVISKINYQEGGRIKDTVLINDLSTLERTREKIDALLQQYDQKLTEPYDVIVKTFTGGKYPGQLESFNKNYIYLKSDKNFFTGEGGEFDYKIAVSDVDEILIKGKANYLTPVLWGAGIGFVIGFLFPSGFSASVNKVINQETEPNFDIGAALGLGVLFAIIGAGVGWGIGWLSADDNETIRFKSNESIIRLKEYARYHFKYDKLFDEMYYEINE
jgi:hypothetical protein